MAWYRLPLNFLVWVGLLVLYVTIAIVITEYISINKEYRLISVENYKEKRIKDLEHKRSRYINSKDTNSAISESRNLDRIIDINNQYHINNMSTPESETKELIRVNDDKIKFIQFLMEKIIQLESSCFEKVKNCQCLHTTDVFNRGQPDHTVIESLKRPRPSASEGS